MRSCHCAPPILCFALFCFGAFCLSLDFAVLSERDTDCPWFFPKTGLNLCIINLNLCIVNINLNLNLNLCIVSIIILIFPGPG